MIRTIIKLAHTTLFGNGESFSKITPWSPKNQTFGESNPPNGGNYLSDSSGQETYLNWC